MEISWTINKKRGYFRPVVDYLIKLTKDEIDLGIPAVKVDTQIPKPVNSWETHCFPEKNERAGFFDENSHEIITPSFKTPEAKGKIILPWRDDNNYPELKEGFVIVRKIIEEEILKAQQSLGFSEKGELDFSSDFREKGTAAMAGDRFLKAVSM